MWLGDDDWLDDGLRGRVPGRPGGGPGRRAGRRHAVYHRDDEVVRHGVIMNLDDARPADRVAAYFDLVEENGVFYGLARADALRRAMPLADEMGGDWFVVARLAYLGRIRTLPDVAIHRARRRRHPEPAQRGRVGRPGPFPGRPPRRWRWPPSPPATSVGARTSTPTSRARGARPWPPGARRPSPAASCPVALRKWVRLRLRRGRPFTGLTGWGADRVAGQPDHAAAV